MSETSNFPWKQIIVTAVLTFLVTIASSTALDYLRTREAKLTYTLSNKIPFPSSDYQETGIYFTTLTNEGRSPAKEITCYIEVSESFIVTCEVSSAPGIDISKVFNNNSITLYIPLLNPSEKIDISFLAVGYYYTSSLQDKPFMSVRGEGITGTEKKITERNARVSAIVFTISSISAFLGLIVFTFLFFRWRKRVMETEQIDLENEIENVKKITEIMEVNLIHLEKYIDIIVNHVSDALDIPIPSMEIKFTVYNRSVYDITLNRLSYTISIPGTQITLEEKNIFIDRPVGYQNHIEIDERLNLNPEICNMIKNERKKGWKRYTSLYIEWIFRIRLFIDDPKKIYPTRDFTLKIPKLN